MRADPLDRMPCDVWMHVLEYGCLPEALKIHDLSDTFERACCLTVRKRMTTLRHRLCKGVPEVKSRLHDSPASYDSLRITILKTVILLRYLMTEVNILFSTVWSYSEHVKAWIFLCPHLIPVIDEFNNLFKTSMNMDVRREEFTTFNMRMLLNTYHEFLRKFDFELAERLQDITGIRNFDTEALDILLACPSINSQLSLSCVINDERFYDISSFFGFFNLKPVFQVPDVHNSSLSTDLKKGVILRYLRECVQWENLTFLQSIISDINDLEFRIGLGGIDDDLRFHLIMMLSDKYETLQDTPYPIVYRNVYINEKGRDRSLNESYHRFSSCNANMTGLFVFVNICNQPQENLPLVIHQYRGLLRPLVDERIVDWDNASGPLFDCGSSSKSPEKEGKHSLQLCIHYREGFNSCPAETIIDVAYDHEGRCHISSNYIESEPFQQFTAGTDTDDD